MRQGLGASLRYGGGSGLALTNYFEPVNEGAVRVGPFGAALSPVGQVMPFYAAHSGGRRLAVPAALGDLDVVATMADGGGILLTVAHLSAVGWSARNLTVGVAGGGWEVKAVETLRSTGFDQDARFVEEEARGEGEEAAVEVPPFSVVNVRFVRRRG